MGALRALGLNEVPDEVLVIIGRAFLAHSLSLKQVCRVCV